MKSILHIMLWIYNCVICKICLEVLYLVHMNAVQIKFCDLVRKELNLSDDKAAAFVTALGEVVESEIKNEPQSAATKEDVHRLELKIEQSKGDLYNAMFWTSIVQLLAILGGVLAIVKFVS